MIAREQLLLVPLPVEVAVGQVVALAGVVERLGAVHLLAAGVEHGLGVDRRYRGVDAHPYPAEQVDRLLETGEVDHRGAVEPQSGEPGSGSQTAAVRRLSAAAEVEGGVDLVGAAG